MSYDLLRFSLLFRRFVNVKADSELLCALFRESSCTSIHLFRAPPQSNQTHKTNTAPIGANNPTQKQNPCLFVRVSLLRLPTQHSTPEDLLRLSRFRAGFIVLVIDYSDDYYYDSSTPTTSLKTPKSKSCGFLADHCQVPPSTLHWTL